MAEGSGSVEGRSPRWVARLTPLPGSSVDDLLRLPLGLDVWERDEDSLVVAAGEGQLVEIERRRLAGVERMTPTAAYQNARPPDKHDSELGEGEP